LEILIDILIITALTEEHQVVTAVLNELAANNGTENDITLYNFQRDYDTNYLIGVVCAHQMGATKMGTFAAPVLKNISPKAAVLIGIAASVDNSAVNIGDVPFSSHVLSYDDIAIEDGKMTFRTEGYQSDPKMRKAVGTLRSSTSTYTPWRNACIEIMPKVIKELNELCSQIITPPKEVARPHLVVEVTAGGPFLLRDAEFRDSLKKLPDLSAIKVSAPVHPKLVSVEMESHGFMNAAHEQGIPACVLKGISDDGDQNKRRLEKETGGYFRAFACSNAVLAMLHILLTTSNQSQESKSVNSTHNEGTKYSVNQTLVSKTLNPNPEPNKRTSDSIDKDDFDVLIESYYKIFEVIRQRSFYSKYSLLRKALVNGLDIIFVVYKNIILEKRQCVELEKMYFFFDFAVDMGYWLELKKLCEELVTLSSIHNCLTTEIKAKVFYYIGLCEYRMSNRTKNTKHLFSIAQDFLKKALNEIDKMENTLTKSRMEIDIYVVLGWIEYDKLDYESGYHYYSKIESIAKLNGVISGEYEAKYYFGHYFYRYLGKYDEAIKNYEDAIAGFKSIGETKKLIKCCNTMAKIHFKINEYIIARTYVDQAKSFLTDVVNYRDFFVNAILEARLNLHESSGSSGCELIESSLKILESLENQMEEHGDLDARTCGEIYDTLGDVYFKKNMLDQAEKYYSKALKYYNSISFKDEIKVEIKKSLIDYEFNDDINLPSLKDGFGITLVAGHPFNTPTLEKLTELQSEIEGVLKSQNYTYECFMPDNLHITINALVQPRPTSENINYNLYKKNIHKFLASLSASNLVFKSSRITISCDGTVVLIFEISDFVLELRRRLRELKNSMKIESSKLQFLHISLGQITNASEMSYKCHRKDSINKLNSKHRSFIIEESYLNLIFYKNRRLTEVIKETTIPFVNKYSKGA
jgi:nucleoside phosphorylase/tetratricopeptide (TPR) repeat protein